MPEHDDSAGEQPTQTDGGAPADEHVKPVVTRRDFIAGAGLGVAATAVVVGGVAVATRQNTTTAPQPVVQTAPGGAAVAVAPAPAPATAPQQTQAQPAAGQQQQAAPQVNVLPQHMRRVTLNIDGVNRDAVVDVRESFW